MQLAGHAETKITCLALGIRRLVIADVTHPGRFFHVIHYSKRAATFIAQEKSVTLVPGYYDRSKAQRQAKENTGTFSSTEKVGAP